MWDKQTHWAQLLETKFMKERKIEYAGDGRRDAGGTTYKGCIAKLMSYQKVQLVKAIRKPAQ